MSGITGSFLPNILIIRNFKHLNGVFMKKTIMLVASFLILGFPVSAKEVKLCGVDWAPFTYSTGKKLTRGISIEIYTEAFKRLGLNFSADKLPWKRCLQSVKAGTHDAIIDASARAGDYAAGKNPTSLYPLAIYVRADHPENKFSWNMMKGKKVGMVSGYYYTAEIEAFKDWKREDARSDEVSMKKLIAKRYDYILIDILTGPITAEKIDAKIKRLKPLIAKSNLFLVFNSKQKDLLAKYDHVIKKMIDDGSIDKIYLNHLKNSYSEIRDLK
jgi:polar amino acid transport system substrate-binding protein